MAANLQKTCKECGTMVYTREAARLSHIGRTAQESRQPGYCGGADLKGHTEQIQDRSSWVHSSFDRWLEIGKLRDKFGHEECEHGHFIEDNCKDCRIARLEQENETLKETHSASP